MTAPAGQGSWRRSARRFLVPSQSPQGRREKCRLRELVSGSAHTPPFPQPPARPGALGRHAGHTDLDEGRECRGPVPGGFPQARQPRAGLLHPLEAPGREPWTCIRPWGSERLPGGRGRLGWLPGPPPSPSRWGARQGAEATILDGGCPRGRKRDRRQRLWEGVPRLAGGGPGDCVLEGENVTL